MKCTDHGWMMYHRRALSPRLDELFKPLDGEWWAFSHRQAQCLHMPINFLIHHKWTLVIGSTRNIFREFLGILWSFHRYPFNAEATFLQSTKTQRFLKTLKTMSCWYSLDSIHWVLSDEYPLARVAVIFQGFCILLYWPNQPPAA